MKEKPYDIREGISFGKENFNLDNFRKEEASTNDLPPERNFNLKTLLNAFRVESKANLARIQKSIKPENQEKYKTRLDEFLKKLENDFQEEVDQYHQDVEKAEDIYKILPDFNIHFNTIKSLENTLEIKLEDIKNQDLKQFETSCQDLIS